MSWNTGVRKVHRWTSIVFVLVVGYVTIVVNMRQEEPAQWVYLMPLLPLAIMAITGLYLLILPWVASLRRRRADG
ncbi:MAG TPA: hypothetical protein VK928_12310 [Longimicrobiales bacterium]|nr:hypothetical protein [Longimicrobiales bacterium]